MGGGVVGQAMLIMTARVFAEQLLLRLSGVWPTCLQRPGRRTVEPQYCSSKPL